MGSGFPILRTQLNIAQLVMLFETNTRLQLQSDDAESDFALFAAQFKFVEAAGGVVDSGKGDILMIHRNGRWDLPKGHREEGESMEVCALREVEEETGVNGLTITKHLTNTMHFYKMKGIWELKQTVWYSMSISNLLVNLTPQIEEGIDRVEWIAMDDLEEVTAGSFPTLISVLDELKK